MSIHKDTRAFADLEFVVYCFVSTDSQNDNLRLALISAQHIPATTPLSTDDRCASDQSLGTGGGGLKETGEWQRRIPHKVQVTPKHQSVFGAPSGLTLTVCRRDILDANEGTGTILKATRHHANLSTHTHTHQRCRKFRPAAAAKHAAFFFFRPPSLPPCRKRLRDVVTISRQHLIEIRNSGCQNHELSGVPVKISETKKGCDKNRCTAG